MIRDNSQAIIPFSAKDSNLGEGQIFNTNDELRIASKLHDPIIEKAEDVVNQSQFELMPIEDQIRELQSQVKKSGRTKSKKKPKKDARTVPISSTPDDPGTAFMT